ncbi:hypothetical protein ACHQM5_031274 [Ranunculus cassubicifolius]
MLIFNSPKHFVACYALPRLWVPRYPPFTPLSARLFGLKNAGFYGRSVTPGCRRRPWGDLVVPTGWRRWGRPMDFPSFCRISLKGLKGDSASSWNPRRAADSNYRPCTIHTRSDQLPILPPLRS